MFNLKITNDDQQVSTYFVNNFSISLNPTGTQQVNADSQQITYTKGDLPLSFNCSNGQSITYVIHTDTRQPDLNIIESFIRQEINAAIANSRPLEISENLIRYYIYLGHETETKFGLKQFSAHKI